MTWPENKYTASLSLDNFRLGDDDAKEIDIGFEFPYSSVFAGSNGYLTFGEGDTTLAASADGHNALPRISALFTDLDPSDDSTYMYAYRGSGVFAVTYVNVKEYSQRSGPRNSFQVVLRDDGSITIAYSAVSTSGVIGVRLSSRGALQQVDLSAGSRTCPAGSSNSDPAAYPIPLQPPRDTNQTLVCNAADGNLYLRWDGKQTTARCVDRSTGDVAGSLICAADATVERSPGETRGQAATCIPATNLMCLEAAGQLVVTWTDKGERVVCVDDSGEAVGLPLDCLGTFQVDRLIKPEPALDARCQTGAIAAEHPGNHGFCGRRGPAPSAVARAIAHAAEHLQGTGTCARQPHNRWAGRMARVIHSTGSLVS